MKVIGIDPGTRHLGWGVIEWQNSRLSHVASGTIHTDTSCELALRLLQIDEELESVLETHTPSQAAVETLFFHKDPQAAAKLGHARGVVLLALARQGIVIGEYQPARVKRTLAGRGQADKRQVALMVRAVLKLEKLPGEDATDALALAITHTRLGGFERAVGRSVANGNGPSQALQEAEQAFRQRRAAHRKK